MAKLHHINPKHFGTKYAETALGKEFMKTDPDNQTATKACEICGKPIPLARLEALPGVTTCVQCASKKATRLDPRKYDLSEASPINRNGFAPKD
jgi:phage/conjugal plasmid C-4 type zinc finger TraR family protein